MCIRDRHYDEVKMKEIIIGLISGLIGGLGLGGGTVDVYKRQVLTANSKF